jgi:hypothetical protein
VYHLLLISEGGGGKTIAVTERAARGAAVATGTATVVLARAHRGLIMGQIGVRTVAAAFNLPGNDGCVMFTACNQGRHRAIVIGGVGVVTSARLSTSGGAIGRIGGGVRWHRVGFLFFVVFQKCVNNRFNSTIGHLQRTYLRTSHVGGSEMGGTEEGDVSF